MLVGCVVLMSHPSVQMQSVFIRYSQPGRPEDTGEPFVMDLKGTSLAGTRKSQQQVIVYVVLNLV